MRVLSRSLRRINQCTRRFSTTRRTTVKLEDLEKKAGIETKTRVKVEKPKEDTPKFTPKVQSVEEIYDSKVKNDPKFAQAMRLLHQMQDIENKQAEEIEKKKKNKPDKEYEEALKISEEAQKQLEELVSQFTPKQKELFKGLETLQNRENSSPWFAGIDEAGCEAVLGPLYIACVVLDSTSASVLRTANIMEPSLSSRQKLEAIEAIKEFCIYWQIIAITPVDIQRKISLGEDMASVSWNAALSLVQMIQNEAFFPFSDSSICKPHKEDFIPPFSTAYLGDIWTPTEPRTRVWTASKLSAKDVRLRDVQQLELKRLQASYHHLQSPHTKGSGMFLPLDTLHISSWGHSPERIQKLFSMKFPHIPKVVVEKNADEKEVAVAAAQLLAQVEHDRCMKQMSGMHNLDFGSGYIDDPKTKAFLMDPKNQRHPIIGGLSRPPALAATTVKE